MRLPVMSILVVDDNPQRVKKFRDQLIGIPTTNLNTAHAANAWLEDHTPKIIFLDYDLHQHGTPVKQSGSGGNITTWLCHNAKRFQHTLVVIHSLNRDAAQKMLEKLHKNNIATTILPSVWDDPATMYRLIRGIG